MTKRNSLRDDVNTGNHNLLKAHSTSINDLPQPHIKQMQVHWWTSKKVPISHRPKTNPLVNSEKAPVSHIPKAIVNVTVSVWWNENSLYHLVNRKEHGSYPKTKIDLSSVLTGMAWTLSLY